MSLVLDLGALEKAGPYIGPRGGKWADPAHTVPWSEHADHSAPTATPVSKAKKPHKYISRKRVGKKWVYTYPEDLKPKKTRTSPAPDPHAGTPAWVGQYFKVEETDDPVIERQRHANIVKLESMPEIERNMVLHAAAGDRMSLEGVHFLIAEFQAGRALYRPKSPEAQQLLAEAARNTPPFVHDDMYLDHVEDQIRGRAYEWACAKVGGKWHVSDTKAVTSLGADPRSASIVPQEAVEQFRAGVEGVFTHNHPSGGFLSGQDFWMVGGAEGVTVIRATRPGGGAWQANRPEGGWPLHSQWEWVQRIDAVLGVKLRAKATAAMDAYVADQPMGYRFDSDRVQNDFQTKFWGPMHGEVFDQVRGDLVKALGFEVHREEGQEEAEARSVRGPAGHPDRGAATGVQATGQVKKARPHKYITRKRVGDRWVYTYPDDGAPPLVPEAGTIPLGHRKGKKAKTKKAADYPLRDPTDFDQLPAALQTKIEEHFVANGGVPRAAMAQNLIDLYERIPDGATLDGEDWYREAGEASASIAKEHDYPLGAVIGAVAALSPQTGWNENLVCAEWMADVVRKDPPVDFDIAITKNWRDDDGNYVPRTWPMRQWLKQEGAEVPEGNLKFSDLDPAVQAQVMRCWSKGGVHTPGGKPLQAKSEVSDRMSEVRWNTGTGSMIKALELLKGDGSPENVFAHVNGHKVQNFYNSIASSGESGICIDTHAVSAAVNRYKPSGLVADLVPEHRRLDEQSLKKLFGGSPSNAEYGVSGTYPYVASAYRDAAETVNKARRAQGKADLSPAQFQAVLWIAWRKEINAEARDLGKKRKAADRAARGAA